MVTTTRQRGAGRGQDRISGGRCATTIETWQAIWEDSGLQDRVVKICQTDPRKEVKDRRETGFTLLGQRYMMGFGWYHARK